MATMKAPHSKLRGIKTPKGKTRNNGNEASFGESYPQGFNPCATFPALVLEGVIAMSISLKERVAVLEKELSHLKQIVHGPHVEKDWRKAFGMSANDPGFDEMIRLGQEIRKQEQEDDC